MYSEFQTQCKDLTELSPEVDGGGQTTEEDQLTAAPMDSLQSSPGHGSGHAVMRERCVLGVV
jgi:hypothetical protein